MQTRAFEQEREDHVLDLTVKSVRSHVTRSVDRVSQVDGGRNKEDAGGSSCLAVDNGTEDLDTDQP